MADELADWLAGLDATNWGLSYFASYLDEVIAEGVPARFAPALLLRSVAERKRPNGS
jgi:hypothetical protein